MAKSNDRRALQKPIPNDRRKGQRRKGPQVSEGAPVRREDDWEKIDKELND